MFFILMLLTSFFSHAGDLKPFSSDGCTLAPDGTWRDPQRWKVCCVAHDLRLWGGGSRVEREEADSKLRSCIKERAGQRVAYIYWLGVRLGSHSPFKIPGMGWGNGWPHQVRYRSLNQDEISRLINEVQQLEIDTHIKDDYILELYSRI